MHVLTLDINEDTRAIAALAAMVEGRARARVFGGQADVARLFRLLPHARRTARVYCGDFTANSHRWRPKITRLTAYRRDDGRWEVEVDRGCANRSFGEGAYLLVDGRAFRG